MMDAIADIRKDYKLKSFAEADAADSPFDQFTQWWNEAIASNIDEVNAMTLATASPEGYPTARIVLLKGFNEKGFEFYTNYESNKGKSIAANNKVALVFFWKELERQIRVEGIAEQLPEATSDAYFMSRPATSRIGAWSSPQSSVIPSRNIIDENVKAITQQFEGKEITRPPFWGGYIVKPVVIEFWQGRSSRLHDRIEYRLHNGQWLKQRLAP
ncbi:pyridoxamine 5'-phosphate oxidase [Ferruginibacter yonginensis]|uniref:Pyridoxine/pyridoxamine 5'-phosphate oxidase n=1 Tax=Ferruginibacter yonginensis TaxID=1310416 RepID=A0ABV8QS42_9BACT